MKSNPLKTLMLILVLASLFACSSQPGADTAQQAVQPPPPAEAQPTQPQLDVTAVVLLEHSYTIELGMFDTPEAAAAFARKHQISTEDAGIAEINRNGTQRYMLAYGIYSSREQARQYAEQFQPEFGQNLQIWTLSDVSSIASHSK